MAYLIIKDGVIVNHHMGGHPTWSPPDGHVEREYDGPFDIGWYWDGTKAIAPDPPAPVQPISGEVL